VQKIILFFNPKLSYRNAVREKPFGFAVLYGICGSCTDRIFSVG